MVFYWDTSALVKRYAQETGSIWVQNLMNPAFEHDIYTIRITGPEMIAALFRKARTGQISQQDADLLAHDFKLDWQQQYQIIEMTVSVSEIAMNLAEKHGLRGYDSVHLAAALFLQEMRQTMNLPAITFVSADQEQNQAAANEGMFIENPNHYL
ncbi:type II toxin-antitoxin system VapC family toxin [Candidatus Parabeggiatoa sp. HSG14]|uniref:type II toxin-antitoxin system VapC family toxin n=1 Tax=Candidatus Parabeggiatoa sp. HSG14 TaxID=3055593 RepID=UPI0025A72571|nr:type II toxin-antitoxin system VapC family toxin [Thiotrichales bacterium HSG14]